MSGAQQNPKAILFACTMNSIRSPMAEAVARDLLGNKVRVESAGVYAGPQDPFVDAILAEIDLALGVREARTIASLDLSEFDIVIALTPQAEQAAREQKMADQAGPEIEFWDIPNPTDIKGARDQMMEAYREALNVLKRRMKERFGSKGQN